MPQPKKKRSERALVVPAGPVQGALIARLNRGRTVAALAGEAKVGAATISGLIQGRITTLTAATARKLLTAIDRLDVLDALLPQATPLVSSKDGEHWVPAGDLMRVLQESYLDRRPGRSIHTLAQETGISARTIEGWADGSTGYVRFSVADRCVTKIGMPDLWHTSELARYYGRDSEAA